MGESETSEDQVIDDSVINDQEEGDAQTGADDGSSLAAPQADTAITDDALGNALMDSLGLLESSDDDDGGDDAGDDDDDDASKEEAAANKGDGASADDTDDTSDDDKTPPQEASKGGGKAAQLSPEVQKWMDKVQGNYARIAEVPGKLRAQIVEQIVATASEEAREKGRSEIADGTKFVPYSDAESGVRAALASGREEGYDMGRLHAEFEALEVDSEARQQLIDSEDETDIKKAQVFTMWKAQGKTFLPQEPVLSEKDTAAAAINTEAREMLLETKKTPGLFEAVQVAGKAEEEKFQGDARSLRRLTTIIERERAKIENGTTDDEATALAESERRRASASKRKKVPKVDAAGDAEARTPITDVERETDVDTLLSVGLAQDR